MCTGREGGLCYLISYDCIRLSRVQTDWQCTYLTRGFRLPGKVLQQDVLLCTIGITAMCVTVSWKIPSTFWTISMEGNVSLCVVALFRSLLVHSPSQRSLIIGTLFSGVKELINLYWQSHPGILFKTLILFVNILYTTICSYAPLPNNTLN